MTLNKNFKSSEEKLFDRFAYAQKINSNLDNYNSSNEPIRTIGNTHIRDNEIPILKELYTNHFKTDNNPSFESWLENEFDASFSLNNNKDISIFLFIGLENDVFPIEFSKFKSLNSLDLTFSKFKSSSNIRFLSNVKNLNLSNTTFDEFPQEISSLSSLVMLNLSQGGHKEFFKDTSNLSNLEWLDISKNEFGYNFPENVFNISNLKYLNVSYCSFNHLPKNIDNSSNLEGLDLSYSSIVDIPKNMINLTALKYINLNKTPLHNALVSPPKILPGMPSYSNETLGIRIPEGKSTVMDNRYVKEYLNYIPKTCKIFPVELETYRK